MIFDRGASRRDGERPARERSAWRTKIKHPHTNGICERFQKAVVCESYQVVRRRTLDPGVDALQRDRDQWMQQYNEARPHQGRWCYGKTPMQTFLDSVTLAKEKQIA